MKRILTTLLLSVLLCSGVQAQMRPPAFFGGIPGLNQSRAVFMQRQQARTLLYREALEELRKNPAAADLPVCGPGATSTPCLASTAKIDTTPPPVAKPQPTPSVTPPPPTGRRLAVLFGNNNYQAPIPPLETPIFDVSDIASVLEQRFGFETRIIKNASQALTIQTLNQVAAEVRPEDSILLFYAGHGYLMEDINMGFWIPTDASVKTAKGWISNQDIAKLLSAIKARQLILVSDSCYSGSLTKENKVMLNENLNSEDVLQRRSVVVLSSGGDEPVSDEGKEGHSIFAWVLLNTLRGTSSSTPGVKIWKTVHDGVSKEYPQEPQYGAVVSAGHAAGGEFLFRPQ